jgi:hypothetical protein
MLVKLLVICSDESFVFSIWSIVFYFILCKVFSSTWLLLFQARARQASGSMVLDQRWQNIYHVVCQLPCPMLCSVRTISHPLYQSIVALLERTLTSYDYHMSSPYRQTLFESLRFGEAGLECNACDTIGHGAQ